MFLNWSQYADIVIYSTTNIIGLTVVMLFTTYISLYNVLVTTTIDGIKRCYLALSNYKDKTLVAAKKLTRAINRSYIWHGIVMQSLRHGGYCWNVYRLTWSRITEYAELLVPVHDHCNFYHSSRFMRIHYRKISNIKRTKSQNLNDSRLVLALSLVGLFAFDLRLHSKQILRTALPLLWEYEYSESLKLCWHCDCAIHTGI